VDIGPVERMLQDKRRVWLLRTAAESRGALVEKERRHVGRTAAVTVITQWRTAWYMNNMHAVTGCCTVCRTACCTVIRYLWLAGWLAGWLSSKAKAEANGFRNREY